MFGRGAGGFHTGARLSHPVGQCVRAHLLEHEGKVWSGVGRRKMNVFFRFDALSLSRLCSLCRTLIQVPVHGDASGVSFVLPSLSDPVLTPLQEGVLRVVNDVIRVSVYGRDISRLLRCCYV